MLDSFAITIHQEQILQKLKRQSPMAWIQNDIEALVAVKSLSNIRIFTITKRIEGICLIRRYFL